MLVELDLAERLGERVGRVVVRVNGEDLDLPRRPRANRTYPATLLRNFAFFENEECGGLLRLYFNVYLN